MEEKKCLKCGRPCADDQAFCDECRADMEKYPVKPGVVVLLPQRYHYTRPAPRRRYTAPSPEEQLLRLKKKLVGYRLAMLLALAGLGVMGWLTVTHYQAEQDARPLPGQNYSSETPGAPEETP